MDGTGRGKGRMGEGRAVRGSEVRNDGKGRREGREKERREMK